MNIPDILMTIFLGLAPISELRGALPYAYFNGLSLPLAAALAVSANLLVYPLLSLFLTFFHDFFYSRFDFYTVLFDRSVISTRKKIEHKIARYGYIGLTLFVAIPLPITGAYTGTLGSWLFGMNRRKAFLAVSLGVFLSATIVSLILLAGEGTYSIFIKHI